MTTLSQWLSSHHIKQATLAKDLGVSPATINLIVNHGKYPKQNSDDLRQKLGNLLIQKGMTAKEIAVLLNSSPTGDVPMLLRKALKESNRAGNKHVLIIEEAHSLPLPTLKHLKRFFELEDGYDKLLGIILIGQNELAIKLSEQNPTIREVVQRCEMVALKPIAPSELASYLQHRLGKQTPLTNVIDDGGNTVFLSQKLLQ